MRESRIRLITVHERSSCASTPSFLPLLLCLVLRVVFECPQGEEGEGDGEGGGGGKRIV